MMVKLSKRTWDVGELVGSGGFGDVKVVRANDGTEAVAKLIPTERGAGRELDLNDALRAQELNHVTPIIDSGEDGGYHVIVMPRAQTSLRQHLATHNGALPLEDALKILADIAAGLVEIKGMGIVHRDLKPDNVLLFDGVWALCDFGIGRFSNAETATATHKYSMTRPYAAPEQWAHERATSATDVYSFGVMAFEVLTGERPFPGPGDADYHEQHTQQQPPPLTVGSSQLRILMEQCLEKAPGARPSPERIVVALEKASESAARPGAEALSKVTYRAFRAQSASTAQRAQQEIEKKRRAELFEVAQRTFSTISERLIEEIKEQSPIATFHDDARRAPMAVTFRVTLGQGTIMLMTPTLDEKNPNIPFDVIASTQITVTQTSPRGANYEGRSHSLWYCDAHVKGQYEWYELAFMRAAFSPTVSLGRHVPFASSPRSVEYSFEPIMGGMQLAWPVEELDRTDLDTFVDRWLGWFAGAAENSLTYPSRLPERPDCSTSYRRSDSPITGRNQ